jgi:hypothetical protein
VKNKHTAEAVKLLADLDADLAAAGEAIGDELLWDTNDTESREALALTVDRRARLRQVWETTKDESLLVKPDRCVAVRRACATPGDAGTYRWSTDSRSSGIAGAQPRHGCSADIASGPGSYGGCGTRCSACRGRSTGTAARRDGRGRHRDQSVTRFTARSGSTPALTSWL